MTLIAFYLNVRLSLFPYLSLPLNVLPLTVNFSTIQVHLHDTYIHPVFSHLIVLLSSSVVHLNFILQDCVGKAYFICNFAQYVVVLDVRRRITGNYVLTFPKLVL